VTQDGVSDPSGVVLPGHERVSGDVTRDPGRDSETAPDDNESIPVAVTMGNPKDDADLRKILDAWPNLSRTIRTGIVAMVRAGYGERHE